MGVGATQKLNCAIDLQFHILDQGSTVSTQTSISLLLGGYSTVSTQYTVPAGWYPDPLGHPQLRWWNGEGWTEQVSAAPEPLVMQPSNFAWKTEEPTPAVVQPVVVQVVAEPVQQPSTAMTPAARELFALEAPRAATVVAQPVAPTLPAAGYTSNYKQAPAAVAPATPAQPEPTYTKYAVTNPELIPVTVATPPAAQPKYFQ